MTGKPRQWTEKEIREIAYTYKRRHEDESWVHNHPMVRILAILLSAGIALILLNTYYVATLISNQPNSTALLCSDEHIAPACWQKLLEAAGWERGECMEGYLILKFNGTTEYEPYCSRYEWYPPDWEKTCTEPLITSTYPWQYSCCLRRCYDLSPNPCYVPIPQNVSKWDCLHYCEDMYPPNVTEGCMPDSWAWLPPEEVLE